MTAAKRTPSSSPMESETSVYAQVNKRRDVNQDPKGWTLTIPEEQTNAVYGNTAPPVPKKNINLKKDFRCAKNRSEPAIHKAEWERDMMTKVREVKALGQMRSPPRQQEPEAPLVHAQYRDTCVYELAGPMPSGYGNVSSVLEARQKQHPTKSADKRTLAKKPKPEPRSKRRPYGAQSNANSASGELVTSQSLVSPIYEDPLPVNPAAVERMEQSSGWAANQLPPPDTVIVDSGYYNYMWQVRRDDMQQIHDACFVHRAQPTRDPNSIELQFPSAESKQRFAETYNNLQEDIIAEQTAGDNESRRVSHPVRKITPIGYSVGDRFCLYIYQADITKLPVDAIVNAANEHLLHAGGIAKAIADAAGPKLITESQTLARKRKLGVTHVVKTTSGNLPCKAVLHAIGPRLPQTTDVQIMDECRKQLMDTYINVVDKANSEQYRSIAMPPISSGIFGVPGDIVIKALIDALLSSAVKYETSKLKEIYVVDIKDDLLELLARQLSDRGLHKAPNGKQVAIKQLPMAEIQQAIKGGGKKPQRSKWTCGIGRNKKRR